MTNDMFLSLIGLTVCAGLVVLGFRNNFKEKTEIRPHRIPWMGIALGAIALGFMIIVHIANLFGLETGRF